MPKDVSIEKIFNDDNEAIKWLDTIENPNIANALDIIYKYAKECLEELGKKDLSEGTDAKVTKSIIDKVKQYISKQENFREKCLIKSEEDIKNNEDNFRLDIFNEDEIKYIQELSDKDIEDLSSAVSGEDKEQKEMISKIKKANRFYNMQLKLAHTARIVRVADEIIKTSGMEMNPDLKDTILTSALLHDIGRFYQAKEYDDFTDDNLKLNKEEYGSGHSKAGYYYSMMDQFRMNFFGDKVDKDILLRTVAGFVVSYHSENNINLESSGVILDEKNLELFSDKDLISSEVNDLFSKIYSTAEYIKSDEEEIKQKDFIRKFMYKMVFDKGNDTLEALGIDKSMENEIIENITESLEGNIVSYTNQFFKSHKTSEQLEGNENLGKIADELNSAVSKGADLKFDTKDVENTLLDMANYDFAKAIFNMFKEKGTEEEEKLKGSLFVLPLNMVMDADKIDILNQLSRGTYPIKYNPKGYKAWETGEIVQTDEAFKRFLDGNEDIILRQADKEDFYKYNGLQRSHNTLGPVRITLWLINQFIFTNMRNKGSLAFIKDTNLIENTYEQFSENKNIQNMLKPYLAYTFYFLDHVSSLENNMLTPDLMKKLCDELYGKYQANDDIKKQYEGMFEGDLLKNRAEFSNKQKVITTEQIGKVTINAPTVDKVEAERVEDAERNLEKSDVIKE